jgi:hypothetical protein
MLYKNFKSLKGELLKREDTLLFANILYKVNNEFLGNEENWSDNAKIFRVLGIEDKVGFCKEAYGYRPREGDFPIVKAGDNIALTKIALALFKKIESF